MWVLRILLSLLFLKIELGEIYSGCVDLWLNHLIQNAVLRFFREKYPKSLSKCPYPMKPSLP